MLCIHRLKDGVSLTATDGNNFSSEHDTFSLCLEQVQSSSIGMYQCEVSNEFGEVKCEAQLIVEVTIE